MEDNEVEVKIEKLAGQDKYWLIMQWFEGRKAWAWPELFTSKKDADLALGEYMKRDFPNVEYMVISFIIPSRP